MVIERSVSGAEASRCSPCPQTVSRGFPCVQETGRCVMFSPIVPQRRRGQQCRAARRLGPPPVGRSSALLTQRLPRPAPQPPPTIIAQLSRPWRQQARHPWAIGIRHKAGRARPPLGLHGKDLPRFSDDGRGHRQPPRCWRPAPMAPPEQAPTSGVFRPEQA